MATTTRQWFELPPGAQDWLQPGELRLIWVPRNEALSPAHELAAWDQLAKWDQLAGRMMRACLFDLSEEPRVLRKQAEAVAAVAEALAVRLGEARG